MRIEQSFLIIFNQKGQQEICRHKLALGKGNKVINTDHKRDKSAAIREMMEQVAHLFPSPEKAMEWMKMIRADKPRYIRDQLIMIKDTVAGETADQVSQAMEYCFTNGISSASDFRSIMSFQQEGQGKAEAKVFKLNPLTGKAAEIANIRSNKNAIEDYESILKKS